MNKPRTISADTFAGTLQLCSEPLSDNWVCPLDRAVVVDARTWNELVERVDAMDLAILKFGVKE
jgi:hypothetical protein